MGKSISNNTIQTFWVFLGSLSAFGFTLVSSIMLSRYFDKSDYGTYKQIMYVYNTLLVVFTLGLPRAYSYFLPRVNNGAAKDLISKLNVVLLVLGFLMAVCLFASSNMIANILKNEALSLPLKYFSLIPLFMIPTMGLEGILATYKQTQFLAIYKVSTQFFMLCCVTIPVIIFKGNINTAILGFTISSFLCFIFALLLKYKPVRHYKKEKTTITYKNIFNYTLPIMGASVWGIIISSSDQFFISRYFGNEVFADFANGSLELPFVGMIISSTTVVLSPLYSKYAFDKTKESQLELLKLWSKVLSKTVKMIYPLVLFSFCFADIIMIILYGDKYATSGIFFQIKLVVNFFTVITYGPLLLSIGGQKFYYNVHMYGALILILLEWIAVNLFNSPYIVAFISVVCQIGRILCMIFFISLYFGVKIRDLFCLKLILNIIIPSVIILTSIRFFTINLLELNNLLAISLSGILYFIFFGLWAYYKKIDYLAIISPVLKKNKS